MEVAARLLDTVFVEKQRSLTEAVTGGNVEAAITAWDEGRKKIVRLNSVVDACASRIPNSLAASRIEATLRGA